MAAVGARERLGRRQVGQDWRHALHPFAESHVVIPFVVNFKRRDAPRDRVIGQLGKLGGPVRVDRPVGFEIAADPVQEFIADRPFGTSTA